MNFKNLQLLIIAPFFLYIFSCSKNNVSNSVTVTPTASITGLACASSSFSAAAASNVAYSATATVPYSGGNAVAYISGAAIASTGVNGLSATLQSGTLANGSGNLTFAISGTAMAAGTAAFTIIFGTQNCSILLPVTAGTAPSLPSVYNKIYGATSITFDGTFVTIKCNGLPDHKSAYYPAANPLHENFSGATFGGGNFSQNPNTILTQTFTFKIPVNPVLNSAHVSTPLGPIGVSINGIPFFNQYAAGGSPLSNEINGFDQWWGHPQNSGMYHYHVEPLYLTTIKVNKHSLLGFLLDGFPVYGTEEENSTAPAGLDVYHGHTHATVDYPGGIYHYHFSTAAPYLNGNGFYGTAGTVTQ